MTWLCCLLRQYKKFFIDEKEVLIIQIALIASKKRAKVVELSTVFLETASLWEEDKMLLFYKTTLGFLTIYDLS